TGQHTGWQGIANTFFHRRDVFARHHTALDGVDEFEAFATGLERLELEHHVTVLTTTARLFDELAFDFFTRGANGFAIGHLRLAHVGLNVELAEHAVDENLEVQFTHTRDNRLAGLFVGVHPERRIFLGQARQGDTHFLLVGLRLGLHRL